MAGTLNFTKRAIDTLLLQKITDFILSAAGIRPHAEIVPLDRRG
jgi:hypothetical protein